MDIRPRTCGKLAAMSASIRNTVFCEPPNAVYDALEVVSGQIEGWERLSTQREVRVVEWKERLGRGIVRRTATATVLRSERGETVVETCVSRPLGLLGGDGANAHEELIRPLSEELAMRKQQILVLSASAKEDIRTTEELKVIRQELSVRLIDVQHEPMAQPDDIQRIPYLSKPVIIHFSGHGTGDGLKLNEASGGSPEVTPAALQRLLAGIDGYTRCVVLNACQSASVAEALLPHVDVCIGTLTNVEPREAVAFSKGFYLALARGDDFQSAFDKGCARASQHEPGSLHPYRMYVNSRCAPGALRLLRSGATAPQ